MAVFKTPCPYCNETVEWDKTKETHTCPHCDKEVSLTDAISLAIEAEDTAEPDAQADTSLEEVCLEDCSAKDAPDADEGRVSAYNKDAPHTSVDESDDSTDTVATDAQTSTANAEEDAPQIEEAIIIDAADVDATTPSPEEPANTSVEPAATAAEEAPALESGKKVPAEQPQKRSPRENSQKRREKRAKKETNSKQYRIYAVVAAAIVLVLIGGYMLYFVPLSHYNQAQTFIENGDTISAIEYLSKANYIKNSKALLSQIIASKRTYALSFEGHFSAEGKIIAIRNENNQVYYLNVDSHSDPTEGFSNISQFFLMNGYAYGIRTNGEAAYAHLVNNEISAPDMQGWGDIVRLFPMENGVVGVDVEGNVYTSVAHKNADRLLADDIVGVFDSAGMFGVREDGTISVPNVENLTSQKESNKIVSKVEKWKNMVVVKGNLNTRVVGLQANGRVRAVNGINKDTSGATNVSSWRNIVDVAVGQSHTVGLQADGTVVAVGNNDYGQCNVEEWTDIVAIEAGNFFTVGIRADGTVLVTGKNRTTRPSFDVYMPPEPVLDLTAGGAPDASSSSMPREGIITSPLPSEDALQNPDTN